MVLRPLLAGLHLPAAPLVQGVGPVPQLFRDQGGDGRVPVGGPLALLQLDFPLAAVVHGLGLPPAVPALVLGVLQDVPDGQLVEGPALPAGKALLGQALGDLPDAQALQGVEPEDLPHGLGLPLVYGEDAVLLVVAPQLAVAQDPAVFHRLAEAELQPLGELAHLILGHPGHDGQPELAVRVHGVDVVVLEQHPHVVVQQLSGVADAVQGGAGEPGDLLGDDKIEPARGPVPDHPEEAVPAAGAGAAQALVDIARHQGPLGLFLDKGGVVLDLVLQAAALLLLVRGHPGVKGHPQGQVIQALALGNLTTDGQQVHGLPPFPGASPRPPGRRPRSLLGSGPGPAAAPAGPGPPVWLYPWRHPPPSYEGIALPMRAKKKAPSGSFFILLGSFSSGSPPRSSPRPPVPSSPGCAVS